jgi:DNA-binding FadR family transcriptional regulator
MVLAGELAAGDWLPPQPELAQRFGVGLSTVREAVAGLSLLGVLDPQPGRGTQISPEAVFLFRAFDAIQMNLASLDIPIYLLKVFEARRALEIELSGLAAERATEDDIAQIGAALQEMQASVEDGAAFLKADQAFHAAVAHASQNPILEQLYHIASELFAQVNQELLSAPGSVARGLRIQEQIFRAICDRDAETARQFSRELLQRVSEAANAPATTSDLEES